VDWRKHHVVGLRVLVTSPTDPTDLERGLLPAGISSWVPCGNLFFWWVLSRGSLVTNSQNQSEGPCNLWAPGPDAPISAKTARKRGPTGAKPQPNRDYRRVDKLLKRLNLRVCSGTRAFWVL